MLRGRDNVVARIRNGSEWDEAVTDVQVWADDKAVVAVGGGGC